MSAEFLQRKVSFPGCQETWHRRPGKAWAVMSEEGGFHHRGPELPVMLASQDPPPLRTLSTTI